MKKTIMLSLALLGVIFLAGCGQQQPVQQSNNISSDQEAYSSDNLGISFQYPKGWYVKENKEIGDGYSVLISNVDVVEGMNKGNVPSDFQQVWISTWEQEVGVEKENNVKNGKPDGREIFGSVSASVINNNGIMINVYEYKTVGGATLEAFWVDKSGKKYYATNSTEVGETNQQKMVENLKEILSTIKFTK